MVKFPRFPGLDSLKIRLALFTLAVFLLSLWLLVAYADWHLRKEIYTHAVQQQASVARFMTTSLEQTIEERQAILHRVARTLGHILEHHFDNLQPPVTPFAALQQHTALPENSASAAEAEYAHLGLLMLQQLFNGGTFIVNAQGMAVAAYPPHHVQRVGQSYADRDYIQTALGGHPSTSSPVISATLQQPAVMMAVPVWGQDAQVVGALVGVLDLSAPNFLEPFKTQAYGAQGHFFVVDRHTRTILAASDAQRLLEQLPPAGRNPVLDHFATGERGQAQYDTGTTTVLLTVGQLHTPAWVVAISMPLEEIYASVHTMRRNIVLAALLLSLLSAYGTWWMLRRELRPLERMAQHLARPLQPGHSLHALEIPAQKEVGQFAQVFNRLLTELEHHQQAMRESEARYRTAFMISPDALEITQAEDGRILDINEGFERLFGWQRNEVIGRTKSDLQLWSEGPSCQALVAHLLQGQPCINQPLTLYHRDGSTISTVVSASLLELEGKQCVLWVTQDMTGFEQAHAQIEWLSSTDALTELPNRQQFIELLIHAQHNTHVRQHWAAVLHIDLDDFQIINDTLGHTLGDEFLRTQAQRLRDHLPSASALARPGGDEFWIILDDLPSTQGDAAREAADIAQTLLAVLQEPIDLQGNGQSCSASMGIVLFGPQHEDPMELLRKVDLTLNQAKNAGPGSVLFYEPQMLDQVSSRARLQRSLREALHKQSFSLHYQPQIHADGQVVGVEALVRWHLQGQGMVSPAEFIPLAEKTGLILPLGRWILHTACTQLAQWAQQPERAQLCMAVNVSAGQFQQDDFVQQVQEVLTETGAPAQQLKLELTESVMVHDINQIIDRMQALRALGVRFSIDDFGTGFSSLAYLKRLPLDQLKIDQGFVRDCLEDHNDASIAQTVIALGQSLGLEVIAEGVETAAHQAALLGWGCRFFQGYGISKPLPIDALEAFLAAYVQR